MAGAEIKTLLRHVLVTVAECLKVDYRSADDVNTPLEAPMPKAARISFYEETEAIVGAVLSSDRLHPGETQACFEATRRIYNDDLCWTIREARHLAWEERRRHERALRASPLKTAFDPKKSHPERTGCRA